MDNGLISITGLWENTDKNGERYFTGCFSECAVKIFKNNHKKTDKQPDYIMYFEKHKKKQPQETTTDNHSEIPF